MEVGGVEPHHARRVGGLDAAQGIGAEQQRHLADVVARFQGEDLLVAPADHLENGQRALEHNVELRRLAFVHKPVTHAQVHVGNAIRERLAFVFRECREERHGVDDVGSDHGRNPVRVIVRITASRCGARAPGLCSPNGRTR